jgi:hypothetical protein
MATLREKVREGGREGGLGQKCTNAGPTIQADMATLREKVREGGRKAKIKSS